MANFNNWLAPEGIAGTNSGLATQPIALYTTQSTTAAEATIGQAVQAIATKVIALKKLDTPFKGQYYEATLDALQVVLRQLQLGKPVL